MGRQQTVNNRARTAASLVWLMTAALASLPATAASTVMIGRFTSK